MKTFTVRLQAMCGDEIGIYLWAHTNDQMVFAGRPIAPFESILMLQAACERVGVTCSEYGGVDSSSERELSAQQLRGMGFKLKGTLLEWIAMSSAQTASPEAVG